MRLRTSIDSHPCRTNWINGQITLNFLIVTYQSVTVNVKLLVEAFHRCSVKSCF